MDEDQKLKILIEFGLDDEQARQAVKRIDELGERTGEAAKPAERLIGEHRALHGIIHLIGHVAGPAMGAAIAGAAAIGTGGIMLAVMAVQQLVEMFADSKKEAEKWQGTVRNLFADTVKNANDAKEAIDKAVKKGTLHKNTAARMKSRITTRIAALAK